LIIKFEIEFPKNISNEQMDLLKSALGDNKGKSKKKSSEGTSFGEKMKNFFGLLFKRKIW